MHFIKSSNFSTKYVKGYLATVLLHCTHRGKKVQHCLHDTAQKMRDVELTQLYDRYRNIVTLHSIMTNASLEYQSIYYLSEALFHGAINLATSM